MSDKTLKRYYDDAQSWAGDRQRGLVRSRTVAWIVAGVAIMIAVLEAIALAALAPLKTVVPYTLLVDRQTGNVEALNPLSKQSVTPDDALVRSFLAQYVTAREGFDISSLRSDYRKVALWSAGEARDRYVSGVQATNPQSYLATLPRESVVSIAIASISSLGPDTALVRFTASRTDPGGQSQTPEHWAAVVTYRFSTSAMSADDRLLNPLGFQVLRYRKNAETAPPEPQASQPAEGLPSVSPTEAMSRPALPARRQGVAQ